MRLFSSRVLWNGVIRFVLFWAIVAATVYATSLKFSILDFPLIHETIGLAFASGHLEGLSSQDFAFALAAMIGAAALGLGCSILYHARGAYQSCNFRCEPASHEGEKLSLIRREF
jgi:hypothetical protein